MARDAPIALIAKGIPRVFVAVNYKLYAKIKYKTNVFCSCE